MIDHFASIIEDNLLNNGTISSMDVHLSKTFSCISLAKMKSCRSYYIHKKTEVPQTSLLQRLVFLLNSYSLLFTNFLAHYTQCSLETFTKVLPFMFPVIKTDVSRPAALLTTFSFTVDTTASFCIFIAATLHKQANN